MIKFFIQKLTPTFLLNWYKMWQYYKIIRDFDIRSEPDLIVARELANVEHITVDIGANIGLYTVYLSPLSLKVISIEPVPFTFSMLTKIIDLFGLTNVSAFQFAISGSDGEGYVEVPIQSGTKNYYRASLLDSGNIVTDERQHRVEKKTINSLFLDGAEDIAFIKCDVEGHELQCVKGAVEFLNRSKPAWMIEVSEDFDDTESSAYHLKSLMERYNYKAYLYENGTLRLREAGDKSINYFFLQDIHLEKLKQSSIKIAS